MDVSFRVLILVFIFALSSTLIANKIRLANTLYLEPISTLDAGIIRIAHANISHNPCISNLNISVQSTDGNVRIGGDLTTHEQANTLIQIMFSVDGVKAVDYSQLRLYQRPVEDQEILVAKVVGTLMREHVADDEDVIKPIEVYAQEGKVTLLGIVEKKKQEKQIVEIVKSVSGVSEVESKIIVIEARRR